MPYSSPRRSERTQASISSGFQKLLYSNRGFDVTHHLMAGHCKALTESRLTRCASTDHLGEAGVVYGCVDLEADYIAPLPSAIKLRGNQQGWANAHQTELGP